MENLGYRGLFIRTDHPREVGTIIQFEFLVRDRGPKIFGKGIVQWVDNSHEGQKGMGVRFTELNPDGRQEIARILAQNKTDSK